MDPGNDASGWRLRSGEDEVGEESSADGGMGEVSFGGKFFFFRFALLQVQFQSLSLNLHKTQVLRPESVDVSDDSWVP